MSLYLFNDYHNSVSIRVYLAIVDIDVTKFYYYCLSDC